MSKISEYSVATSSTASGIETNVNEKIVNGWQPFGSIQVAIYPGGKVVFAQSMIKTETKARAL